MKLTGFQLNASYLNEMIHKNESPLHVASMIGNLNIVKHLIEVIGFEPWLEDENGDLLLSLNVLIFLTNAIPSVKTFFLYSGKQPIHYAAIKGHIVIVRYLIEAFCQILQDDCTDSPVSPSERS